jgi:Papain family cysteine protease
VDPSSASGQASPAFIYVQVLKDGGAAVASCGGSSFKPYFDMLAAHGTPTMHIAPYVADCGTLWREYANARPDHRTAFEIGPIASIEISDLDDVKHVLASNRALAYGTKLYTDWKDYRGDPVPYSGHGIIIVGKSGKPAGHCMLIIGHNDTMRAVLIQNSQGTAWGRDGYVWMAYETFQALAQGQAFYVDD